ncbi:MAG: hypothetical protein R8K47_07835 [Mariprofundaceae bacterium]
MNLRLRNLVARWTGGLMALQLLLSGQCLMPLHAHAGTVAPEAVTQADARGATVHCPAMSGGMTQDSEHAPAGCAHCDQPDTALNALPALDAPVLAPLAVLQPVSTDAGLRPAAFDVAAMVDDTGPGGGAFLLYRTTQRLRI